MKYFTLSELSKSDTAKGMGIDNTPTPEAAANLTKLVDAVLDPLRERYGYPINVSSGYRCYRLNKAVGGSATSDHMNGMVADIYCNNPKDNAIIFAMIYWLLPYDQLIWEKGNDEHPAWVHVSYREGNNRRECKRTKDGVYYFTYKPHIKV